MFYLDENLCQGRNVWNRFSIYMQEKGEKSDAIKEAFKIYARLKAAEADLAQSWGSDLFIHSPFKLLVNLGE